jgi:peptide/nickel transport system substrate-binding protein
VIRKVTTLVLAALVLAVGCAPQTSSTGGQSPQAAAPAAKKQFTAAVLRSSIPTIRDTQANKIHELVMAGLSRVDVQDEPHAQLAEAVPTLENGLWKLLPDGGMETTWKIRPDATWHDGTPVTSADYLFGATVSQDRELGESIPQPYGLISGIEAPDARTVVINWKGPFVQADTFSGNLGRILPKHLLESAYTANKASFYSLPYWNRSFIHAGPYRITEFEPDSHVLLDAFDSYVLGRPKIDRIEVKFIGDVNTLVTNILAGVVELTLGQNFSPEQARDLKSRYTSGTMVTSPVVADTVAVIPQFINPEPAALADLRFRRALTHAFNRQELIDTILDGQVPIAHAIVGGLHPQAERAAFKYEYDPRRAAQLIEEMGYRKGSDGVYQDAGGRPLAMEVRGIQEEEIRVKTTLFAEASWRQLGIATNLLMVPDSVRDLSYLQTWPGMRTKGYGAGLASFTSYFHSSRVPLPENNFSGGNGPRYMNPELDSLIDRFNGAIPKAEREQLIDQAVRHVTENATAIGAFYVPYMAALSNRLVNVTTSSFNARGWDAHLWDIK